MLQDLVPDPAGPAADLVSLVEAKAHLGVDFDTDDVLIQGYIAGVIGHVDGYSGILGRALVEQTWTLYLDRFPGRVIRLPLPPLISVDEITYVDGDGATQTLAADRYNYAAGERAQLEPAYGLSWPGVRCQTRAIAITFTCGWEPPANLADPAAWPQKLGPVRVAALMMVKDLYDTRESQVAEALVTNEHALRLAKLIKLPRA